MKDLQLTSGDLVPANRGFSTVTGAAYLQQRISIALQVPYGSDPYNPSWGSVLDSYIGHPQGPGTPALVSSEVSRVLSQIVAYQQHQMKAAILTGAKSQLNPADVIASVDSVDAVQASFDPSTISVVIALTTQEGQQVTISRTVSGN